jgi:hypothetical protein
LLQEETEHELPVGGLEGVLEIVEQLVLGTIRGIEEETTFLVGSQFVENFLAVVSKISEVHSSF